MILLANQLTLSSIQIKNGRSVQAIELLQTSQQTFQDSVFVKNNLSVMASLNGLGSDNFLSDTSNTTVCLERFQKLIVLDPLNYVGYYNLFNFKVRLGDLLNLRDALKNLIQAISCLNLHKALIDKSEKLVNLVLKQYCSCSILVLLVKAIIHVQNQKYVIAVSDLSLILSQQNNMEISDKVLLLNVIKNIFASLGQKSKEQQTSEQIQKLTQAFDNQNQKPRTHILTCSFNMPTQLSQVTAEISKRLQQFGQLIKQAEFQSFKTNLNTPNLVFKQIKLQSLKRQKWTIQSLLRKLNSVLLQSPVSIKNQQKLHIRRSHNSQVIFQTRQSEIIFNPTKDKRQQIQTVSPQQNRKQNKSLSMSIQSFPKNDKDNQNNVSADSEISRKLDHSLTTSGFKGKKKTQKIYPLEKQNQQVEVKLVMAQLTNNKQLMGNMDPYCILVYNGQKKKSSVIKAGGFQPRWKQSFTFTLTEYPAQLSIEVYDQENFFKKDDFVGSGKQILEKNGFIRLQIYDKQKPAGIVFITIQAKN